MNRVKSPLLASVLTALLTALLVGGIAVAQTSTPVLTACADKTNGSLRLVGDASDCRNNEVAVSWNRDGAPGSKGDKGDPGEDGADGADGVSGREVVEGEAVNVPAGAVDTATAACSSGKAPVGGGFAGTAISDANGTEDLNVIVSRPATEGAGWQVSAHNDTTQTLPLRAYVICALVS